MTSWTASLHVLTNCCCIPWSTRMVLHKSFSQLQRLMTLLLRSNTNLVHSFVRMSLANLFCGKQLPPVFHWWEQGVLWQSWGGKVEQSLLHKLILTASFQHNRLPFLFLGLIFGGPFSWQFWFFTPTYGVSARIQNICHIPPFRFHKHVCSSGHVGLNFTLLMQSLINVGQHYVPVLLEGLLLVADHGVTTQLLMTPWMPVDQH